MLQGGGMWRILQHTCILMMCFFRSAKVAVIATADFWFYYGLVFTWV